VHLVDQLPAAGIGAVLVYDDRERIDRVAVDQDIKLHQRSGLKMAEIVVEGGIAATGRFETVEEIQHHLGQRQIVLQRHGVGEELHFLLHAALLAA